MNQAVRAQELCESRGGRPRLPDPNKPGGFCGRKATLKPLSFVAVAGEESVVPCGLPSFAVCFSLPLLLWHVRPTRYSRRVNSGQIVHRPNAETL